eukprot:jgi/Tetstr1/440788/TSEL_029096.t1
MTYFSRALHKVLVLASNTGSYLTAVAWLQAGSNTVGGLSPFALDGGTRHLVGLFVFTCFVTWVVWHSLNWLVEKQLGAAQAARAADAREHCGKVANQALSVGLASLAASGAYIMLYLWAAVFVGFSDTSTVLRLWVSVGIITLGVAAVIALADKEMGPFAGLHQGRSEAHKETLHGMFVFNGAFMLAVMWEVAMELTFHRVMPELQTPGLARGIFCICVVVVCCFLLFAVPELYKVLHSTLLAQRGRIPVRDEQVAPLLETYLMVDRNYHVGHVVRLAGHMASLVLNWVMGLAISFNVRGGVSTFTDPDEHDEDWGYLQWIAYTAATTLFFVGVSALLEEVLLKRTLGLADRVGVTSPDISGKLAETAAAVDFQGGLTWYQENVIVPLLHLAEERIRSVSDHAEEDAAELSNIKFLEKESATFSVVVAFMAGFAWNNLIALIETGKAAQLAPQVDHYWWQAAGTTVVAVAVSMYAGIGHVRLNEAFGLLGGLAMCRTGTGV